MASHRLSHSTFALLVSNVGSAGLSFVLAALIGRTVGTSGLGVYATALAWVFPVSLVADFGLGTLITREVAKAPETARNYLEGTAAVRLWLGGGLTLVMVLGAPLLSGDPAVVRGLQISAPLVAILPFFGAFTAIFRARQAMWPIAWLNLGMLAAQVALTALVFLVGGDVLAALAVNTATSAGQLLAAWWVYRRWFVTPPPDPLPVHEDGEKQNSTQRRKDARNATKLSSISASRRFELLRQAWPFALAAILAALQTRVSVILLERLADSASVGYYGAAARFVEAGRMIPNALFGALFPMLAALAADSRALHRLFARVMIGLAAYAVILVIGFGLLAAPIIALTFGQDFAAAVIVSLVAMGALLPGLLRAGRTLYWYALGREQLVNRVTGLALLVQVSLSLWLIPAHGALGAALVNVVVESAALALLYWPGMRRVAS